MASHVSLSPSKMVPDSHEGVYAIILILTAAAMMGGAYLTLRPLFSSDLAVHAPARSAPDDITPI
jgi:hypothetical protein